MAHSRARRWLAVPRGVLAALFALLICLPGPKLLLSGPIPLNRDLPVEQRAWPPAKWLRQNPSLYVNRVKSCFGAHFGFRDQLVKAHAAFKVFALGVSPTTTAVFGSHGWLYYTGEPHLVDYYRCARPYTPEQLAQCQARLESRSQSLARRGASYLLVIAPNKASIYPEFLPRWLRNGGRPSRADQLVSWLRAHSSVRVLDLRGPLVAAKPLGRLFSRTDTHWNDLGAYVGYTAIMECLRAQCPAMRTRPLTDFRTRTRVGDGGDEARMIGLPTVLREEWISLAPRHALPTRITDRAGAALGSLSPASVQRDRLVSESAARPVIPRVVVFRDSFSSALEPFLSPHFGRAVWVWRTWDEDLIAVERPNLVVQEVIERYLGDDVL